MYGILDRTRRVLGAYSLKVLSKAYLVLQDVPCKHNIMVLSSMLLVLLDISCERSASQHCLGLWPTRVILGTRCVQFATFGAYDLIVQIWIVLDVSWLVSWKLSLTFTVDL